MAETATSVCCSCALGVCVYVLGCVHVRVCKKMAQDLLACFYCPWPTSPPRWPDLTHTSSFKTAVVSRAVDPLSSAQISDLKIQTDAVPPISTGDTFQDCLWMPETLGCTRPDVSSVFPTHKHA